MFICLEFITFKTISCIVKLRIGFLILVIYRVILVFSEFGWVDLDVRCSTILLWQ